MSKHHTDPDEAKLFALAMQGVKRIQSDRVVHSPQRKPPVTPPAATPDTPSHSDKHLSDGWELDTVTAEEVLSFAIPGIRSKVMRMLKRGEFAIEAHLDLHGMTTEQARNAVSQVIAEASQHHCRCIRVVHGKGYRAGTPDRPLLKNRVNHWLKQHPHVLAFHSAQPRHGGTGAVYVLLKNQSDNNGHSNR